MRRLFIIRKDLHLSPGKLAAMVGHCCEAYWTNLIRNNLETIPGPEGNMYRLSGSYLINSEIVENYINGIFTKTICEARNLDNLKKKVIPFIEKCNLREDYNEYGWINDKCLTELTPENEDGTTTVGIWFHPMKDEVIQELSKKFKLYRD